MPISSIVVATAGIVMLLGVAPAAPTPLAPMMVDWQRYFALDWQATQKDGRSLVTGTVSSTSACGAKRIQLLIDGLDPNGQLVDQRVVWLGTDLPAGSHVYFEVPAVPRASNHRVSVFAFEVKKDC
jgi:hypothetical protein